MACVTLQELLESPVLHVPPVPAEQELSSLVDPLEGGLPVVVPGPEPLSVVQEV